MPKITRPFVAAIVAALAPLAHAEPPPLLRAGAIALTPTAYAMRHGDDIGPVRSGAACSQAETRAFSELIAARIDGEIRDAVAAQFAPSAATPAAAIELTPFVNDLRVDLCAPSPGSWQGRVLVQISWTAVLPDSRRIVYQASTVGAAEQRTAQAGSVKAAVRSAVQSAVAQLRRDGRFAAVLDGESAAARPLVATTTR